MKKLFTLVIVFYSLFSYAQKYTLPQKLVKAYLKEGTTIDIIVETILDKDNFYEINLKCSDKTSTFKLKPLTFPNFQSKFKDAIIDVLKQNDPKMLIDKLPNDREDVENNIAYVFTQIVTYYNTQEERPEVATIYLKENIPVYRYLKNDRKIDKTIETTLNNAQVEISFYGGFIEKMQVSGTIGNVPITFNNKFSIGISSNKNIKQLNKYSLYSDERFTKDDFNTKVVLSNLLLKENIANKDFSDAINAIIKIDKNLSIKKNILDSLENNKAKTVSINDFKKIELEIQKIKNEIIIIENDKATALKDVENKTENLASYKSQKNKFETYINIHNENSENSDKRSLAIHVSDIIRYVKKVDVNANDISPVPQLVLLDKNQKETKLYREESSKLFEAVVYTDFLGIFDDANPNGIIQTEINKQFNITSRRFDVFPAFIEAIGFLNYFNAQFQFSKIEKNNKFLLPSNFDVLDSGGNVTETIAYYSPISLYQYRNYAIGGQLNVFIIENQNAKINTTLDAGFLFGRSGIKETENQVDGIFINNLEIPIELKFLILPEKRFSFSVSDRLSWFESFDADINLKSIENEKLMNKNRWLNTFNIGLNLDVSTNGKLFLRYKLIHELDNINTNFSQLQFGYSFYLLQKNGARKSN